MTLLICKPAYIYPEQSKAGQSLVRLGKRSCLLLTFLTSLAIQRLSLTFSGGISAFLQTHYSVYTRP